MKAHDEPSTLGGPALEGTAKANGWLMEVNKYDEGDLFMSL
jgi:hypothetical protein